VNGPSRRSRNRLVPGNELKAWLRMKSFGVKILDRAYRPGEPAVHQRRDTLGSRRRARPLVRSSS
jgi:hypothetical protein